MSVVLVCPLSSHLSSKASVLCCLFCAAASLCLQNLNSDSGSITSCFELPGRTLTLHLYLFKMLLLRFISCLVNLSTSSHWLAFLHSLHCRLSLFKTLPGLPHELLTHSCPEDGANLSHPPASPSLMFLAGVGKVPCGSGGAALLATSWAGVAVPLSSDAWVTADAPVRCLVLASACAPVLPSSGNWYLRGQSPLYSYHPKIKPW